MRHIHGALWEIECETSEIEIGELRVGHEIEARENGGASPASHTTGGGVQDTESRARGEARW